jgi:hypothetical protein
MSGGRHVLQLIAIDGSGQESARSDQFVINLTQTGRTIPPSSSSPTPPVQEPTRACGADACFRVDTIAAGLDSVGRLSVRPDGRVMFLRNATQIVVLSGGSLNIAYDVTRDEGSGAQITDFAIDPDFETNHLAYLGIVSRDRYDHRSFRIARVREAGDWFGQTATIMPGIPLVGEDVPPMTVGANHHIYVAVPGGLARGARDAYSGVVLRFDSEGGAAGYPSAASPIFAVGSEHPNVLTWDRSNRLWLGAAGTFLAPGLQFLSPTGSEHRRSTTGNRVVIPGAEAANDTGIRDLSFSGSAGADSIAYAVTERPRTLLAMTISNEGLVLRAQPVSLASFEPLNIAAAPGGALLVAAKQRGVIAGSALPVTLLRLTPGPSAIH